MYICIYAYIHMYIYIYVYIYTCLYVYGNMCPDTYICMSHMSKETYSYVKRDLFICQKRPIHMITCVQTRIYVCHYAHMHK